MAKRRIRELSPDDAIVFEETLGRHLPIISGRYSAGIINKAARGAWFGIRSDSRYQRWEYTVEDFQAHARIAVLAGKVTPSAGGDTLADPMPYDNWELSEHGELIANDETRISFLSAVAVPVHPLQRVNIANRFKIRLGRVALLIRPALVREAYPDLTSLARARKTGNGLGPDMQDDLRDACARNGWDYTELDPNKWPRMPADEEVWALERLDASLVTPPGESESMSSYATNVANRTAKGRGIHPDELSRHTGAPLQPQKRAEKRRYRAISRHHYTL